MMNLLKRLCMVILISTFVILQILYINILVFRKGITKDTIKKGVAEVDFVEVLKQDNDENPLTSTKMDQIYEIAKKGNISTKSVDAFIRSEGVKDFANTYLNDLIDSIFSKEEKNITSEELKQVTTTAVNTAVDESGIPLPDSIKQSIILTVSQNSEKIISLLPTTQTITSIIDEKSIATIEFLFSSKLKIIFFGIVVVFILLLMVLTHSFYRFFFYHGIASVATACVSYLFSQTFTSEFLVTVFSENIGLKDFFIAISPTISNQFMLYSKIFLLISVVQFILFFGINYWQKSRSLHKSVNNEQ